MERLACILWSRPHRSKVERYESAVFTFHTHFAELRRDRVLRNASYRLTSAPWLAGDGAGYEDLFAIESYSDLAALKHLHFGPHLDGLRDAAATPTKCHRWPLLFVFRHGHVRWRRGSVAYEAKGHRLSGIPV